MTENVSRVFVFGSNLAGRHGKGAAKYAWQTKDAKWGVGEGPTGAAYALPTCDGQFNPLPYGEVERAVWRFLEYARSAPHLQFQVTCVGTGLGGFSHRDIAPMFEGAPRNCLFDTAWQRWLGTSKRYWGTYGK